MITDSTAYKNAVRAVASEITVPGGRILVTGSTGLIGSCLVDVLLEANASCGRHFELNCECFKLPDILRIIYVNRSILLKIIDIPQNN